MSERLDPEEVHEILNDCLAGLAGIVMKYEATVDKYMGDCIMALFGAPIAHENDPERAIRAALEMQEYLSTFSQQNLVRTGVPLQMRIGINTGLVIAAEVGHDLKRDYTVMGDAVNTAQRLEAAAPVGGVLVSDATFLRTRKLFRFDPQPPITVKNKAEPLKTYVVTGLAATRERLRGLEGLTAPMIGRDAELAMLLDALTGTSSGHPTVVSLAGEAGLGKSRLLAEFKETTSDRDVMILEGHCVAHGTRTPYLPFIDLLRQVFGILPGDDEETVALRVRHGTSAIDPSLEEWSVYFGALLSVSVDAAAIAGLDPETRQRLTRQAIRGLLACLADLRPVVLVIEDMHWVDSLTLSFLDSLASDPPASRWMMLALHRTDFQMEWLAADGATQILLRPLDVYQSLMLVDALLDAAELPSEIKDLILSRSEGNPFFVEEVLRSLIDAGALEPSSHGWRVVRPVTAIDVPVSLAQVIAARIDHLEESQKGALRCASVLGRRFAVRLLEGMTRPMPGLKRDLDRLVASDFIQEEPIAVEPEYLFKHELIREVAYQGMLQRRRRALHQQAGEIIETACGGSVQEQVESLAHHFELADNPSKALGYLIGAARKSQSAYANADAVDFFKRALRMFERLASDEAGRRLPDRIAIDEGLATLHILLGELDDAKALLTEAAAVARRHAERPEIAGLGAEVLRKLSEVIEARGDVEGAGNLLDEALEMLTHSPETHAEHCRIYRAKAKLAYLDGDYARAESEARRAVQAGALSNSPADRASASSALGSVLWIQAKYEDARKALSEASILAESIGDLRTTSAALYNLGGLALDLGDYTAASDYYARSLRLAERIQNRMMVARCRLYLGQVTGLAGNVETAEEHMRSSLAIWQEINVPVEQAVVLERLGHLYFDTGQYDRALQAYRESRAIRETQGDRAGIAVCMTRQAAIDLLRGRLDEGEALLEQSLAIREELADRPGQLAAWGYRSHLHWLRGEFDLAERLARRVISEAQELESSDAEAWGNFRLARVAWITGRIDEAISLLLDAVSLMRDSGNLMERVEIDCELAFTFGRAARYEEAEATAREALRLAERTSRPSFIAGASCALACALAATARPEEAEALFARAVNGYSALGESTGTAAAMALWGVSGGDQGSERIAQSRRIIEETGAVGLLRLIGEPVPKTTRTRKRTSAGQAPEESSDVERSPSDSHPAHDT